MSGDQLRWQTGLSVRHLWAWLALCVLTLAAFYLAWVIA
jgi:hypothetical protein